MIRTRPTPHTPARSSTARRCRARAGLAMVDILAVLAVIALLLGILLPSLTRARATARQVVDMSNLRQMGVALNIAAIDNRAGRVPLPSELDPDGRVIPNAGPPELKDISRNWYASLVPILGGSAEVFISAVEPNPAISAATWDAVDAGDLPWNPAFAATPDDRASPGGAAAPAIRGVGSASFAHMPLVGRRAGFWRFARVAFPAQHAVMANRGPRFMHAPGMPADEAWVPLAREDGAASLTLGMFGPRDEWHGNALYVDGHVNLLTEPVVMVPDGRGGVLADNIFEAQQPPAAGEGVAQGRHIAEGDERFAQPDLFLTLTSANRPAPAPVAGVPVSPQTFHD